MSNEKSKEQERTTSILDVQPRIREGAHAVVMFLIAVAIIAVAWVLYAVSIVSLNSLLLTIVVVGVSWLVLTNAEFVLREWLHVDVENRRADKATEFTPDTNTTDRLMGLPYEELTRSRDGSDEHS